MHPRRDGPSLRVVAAKGVFWTATSNWGNELTRLLVFVILARLLLPQDFGLVALALVFIGFTQIVADQGLVDAVVQRKNLVPAHLDSAFWMSMAFGVLLAAALAGLAVPLALLLDEPRLAPVLVALSLSIPISSLNLVQRAILTRDMAFRSLAMRTLISIGVGAVFGVSAALLGFGVWSLVAQHLASPIAGVFVLWRVSEWRPRLAFSHAHFRELFGFGVHVVSFRLLNYFTRRSDELFIGAVLGPASLGFYTVGYRMLRLLFQVTSSLIDTVAFPLYSRLQDEPDRLRRAYYKSTSFAALIAFPAFMGAMVMAPQIVTVLFGPKWAQSVPIMQILAALGVIQLLTYLNGTMVKALGKPSWQVVIGAITSALKVVAFVVAVRYGVVAVATAALCVGYFVAPMWYWAVNRLTPIGARVYFSYIRGPLVASILSVGVMLAMRHVLGEAHALLTLLAAFGAGGLVYIGAIQIVARPLADEALELARRALPTVPFARRARALTRR